MSSEDVTLRLRLLDEFSATTKKYVDELKKLEGASKSASGKVSAGFDINSRSMSLAHMEALKMK